MHSSGPHSVPLIKTTVKWLCVFMFSWMVQFIQALPCHMNGMLWGPSSTVSVITQLQINLRSPPARLELAYLAKTNRASSFNGSNRNGPFSIHENLLLSIDSVSPASRWLTPHPNSYYQEHCTLIKPDNKPVVSRARKYEEASAGLRNSWLPSM